MEYFFTNGSLSILIAALASFVAAGLAAWWIFRSMAARRLADHRFELESVQANLDASDLVVRESEAKAKELRVAAEADAAKIQALEAKLQSEEASAKIEMVKANAEVNRLRQELNRRADLGREDASALQRELAELKTARRQIETQLSEQLQHTRNLENGLEGQTKEHESKTRDLEGALALMREETSTARSQKQAAEAQSREIEQEFRKVMTMREEEFRAMQSQTVAAVEAQTKFEQEAVAVRLEVAARDAEIARLTAALDQPREPEKDPEMEQIREELREARANLAGRNELLSKLEADAGLLSHVRHGMRERQTRIDGLQLQLAKVRQESDDLRAQLRERNDSSAKLEADAALLSHLRHGMRERQTRIDGLQLQLSKARQETDDLRSQIRARNESSAKLEADAALLSHVRQGMRARQTQIDGLQLQLKEARAEVQKLTSLPATSSEPTAEFVEVLAAKDRQLQLLEANLMEAKSAAVEDPRVAALQAELASRDAKLDAIQAEFSANLKEARSTAVVEDPRVAALQAEVASGEAILEAIRAEFAEIAGSKDRQLQLLEANLMEANSTVVEDARVAALQAEVASREAKLESLQAEFAEMAGSKDRQLQLLEANLMEAKSVVVEDPRVAALQAELASGEAEFAEIAGAKDRQLQLLEANLMEAKSAAVEDPRVAALQTELAHLEAKLESLQAEFAEIAGSKDRQLQLLEANLMEAKSVVVEDPRVAALQAEVASGEAKLEAIQAEFAEIAGSKDRQLQLLEANLMEAKSGAVVEDPRVAALQAEVASREAKLEAIQAEFAEIAGSKDRQLQLLEANLMEAKSIVVEDPRVAALQTELAHREAKLESLQAEFAEMAGAKDRQLQLLEANLMEAKSGTGAEDPRVAALQAEVASREAKLEAIQAEFAEMAGAKDRQLQLLEANLMEAKSTVVEDPRVAALQAEVASREAKLEAIQTEFAEMAGAKDRQLQLLEANLMEATSAVTEDPRVAALQAEVASGKAKLEAIRAEFAEMAGAKDRQLQLLEANLLEAKSGAVVEDPRVAALQAELANREAELQTLNTAVADAAALRLELADREERLEAWESRYQATIGEMHAAAGFARMSEAHPGEAELIRPLAFGAAAGSGGGGIASVVSTSRSSLSVEPALPTLGEQSELQARLRLVSLRGIQFLPDSDEILEESMAILADALRALHQLTPEHRVEIGGHTDSWGDPAHNRELSLRRAKSVRRYLVENGVPAAMLIATGYGDSRPIADNDLADGRFANRRIEFQVRGPVR